MNTREATCIGCGCDDSHACIDSFEEPCGWLIVDRREARGVCSRCPNHLARWKAGDRVLSALAARAIKRREAVA